jgi:hypothetical protein
MNSKNHEERRKPHPAPHPRIDNALIRALREAYGAIGLDPDHALRSALADYECQFEPAVQCAA